MRHRKKFNHLGRKAAHRKAMLANMACSLIQHKRINTTVAKAKALRMYVEPLLTKAKQDTTHSRRTVFSYLQNKEAVTELFREIAPKIANRPGGYTRILKTGFRLGDGAEMCLIELVDFNETYTQEKGAAKAKSKTRRRRKKSSGTAASTKADAATPEAKKSEENAKAAAQVAAELEKEEAQQTAAAEEKKEEKAEEPKAKAKKENNEKSEEENKKDE
ncbi:MAG: 50S ribosomal protein L17 [Bacteroidetes bacterium]|nr:MAG: 50S ribosomal protein L17 [Bacteroidota bacterium]